MKIRLIERKLVGLHAKSRGRLVVLTGARQTGKSTLARAAFADHAYVSLDAPQERVVYERFTANDWLERFPRLVVDEAQKLPALFDTIKACYDRNEQARYVLLGSSQILMLKQVSESLAGRAALRELFPFCIPEIAADDGQEPVDSLLVQMLRAPDPAHWLRRALTPDYSVLPSLARSRAAWEQYVRWGGMPPVHQSDWQDDDRFEWLRDYHSTYLQRDLADLARLDRLEPFVRAQQAAALRSAQVINFSELARLSDISPPTARQFMRYLEMSYQVALLPAWFRNAEKRLAKQPKLHFLDPGVRRGVLSLQGAVSGAEFESAVVSEIIKQCRTYRLAISPYHLRTVDGREVDLLLEREDGFIAIECKQSERLGAADFRHLRGLEELLDKPLLLGLVVANEKVVSQVESKPPLWSITPWALLGSLASAVAVTADPTAL